jgi:hypothetical protein
MLDKRSITAAVSLLLLTACSSAPSTGPWPRAYQLKFGENVCLGSDGQGHVLYLEPVKDAQTPTGGQAPRQYTVYDLKKRYRYEWADGGRGFTKKELKQGENPPWYFTQKGIEEMESNANIKKLGEKRILDLNCKGFSIFQKDPFGGMRISRFGPRMPAMDMTQELWVSPEYELVVSRGINGSSMTPTSFSGNSPEQSLFGPAIDEKAGGMINLTEANAAVFNNMQSIKSLVDMYAGGHEGNYPGTARELNIALAQGHATGLLNPISGKHEFPLQGGVADVKTAREAAPRVMAPGSIEYNVLPGGRSYAIIGGDGSGKSMSGDKENTTMVLSNM